MPEEQNYVEYLVAVVKGIVKYPDEVKVDRKNDEMGVLLTLSVNPQDMGLVIGKSGETAKSIRTLLRTAGIKSGARLFLKITDPQRGETAV